MARFLVSEVLQSLPGLTVASHYGALDEFQDAEAAKLLGTLSILNQIELQHSLLVIFVAKHISLMVRSSLFLGLRLAKSKRRRRVNCSEPTLQRATPAQQIALVSNSFLLLVVRPGAPSSVLLLVAMPFAPSSVLAPNVTSFLSLFSSRLRCAVAVGIVAPAIH